MSYDLYYDEWLSAEDIIELAQKAYSEDVEAHGIDIVGCIGMAEAKAKVMPSVREYGLADSDIDAIEVFMNAYNDDVEKTVHGVAF